MIIKPQRIQLSLTIQFAVFFVLLSAFIYFFFTSNFEESIHDKYIFKSSILVRYLEQNPQIFHDGHIKDKTDLVQLLHLNDVLYCVILDEKGNMVDAVNIDDAEHYIYLLSDKTNHISSDKIVYRLALPFNLGNENQTGKIYVGYKAGAAILDLNKRILSTVFYSLIVLLGGIIFTFFLSSISFRPVVRLYTALNKTNRFEQKNLLSKFKNDELGLIAGKIYDMLDQLDHSSNQVENLNEQLRGQFREKIYELDAEISQRKKAETYLRKTEEMFRLLFENAPIGMVIISKLGKVIRANRAFCNTVGYNESELFRMHIKTFFNDNHSIIQTKKSTYQMVIENESLDLECKLTKKDGRKITALLKTMRIDDENGERINTLLQVLDISHIKMVQSELVNALDQAKESDRLKSAFLAQMSHEIRTPLNVILPSIPILADEVGDKDKEMVSILDAVANASKRLQRTIDMILSMSAVQSGNYKANFDTIDLGEDLKNLTQEFKPITKEKGLELIFTNNSSNSEISADRYTIGQVFQNLIGNAVKYTQSGKIIVSVNDHGENKLIISVEDTGIGISEKYLKNIFSPFSQEDAGQTRKYEGNGLGLALVKEYVTLNKGQISVQSEKNKGSVFSVVFDKKLIKATLEDRKVLLNET